MCFQQLADNYSLQGLIKRKGFMLAPLSQLRRPFQADKTAKVVGKLASVPLPMKMPKSEGNVQKPRIMSGVLVQNYIHGKAPAESLC